jgi:carbon monoxide dehydrogenase subunit G
MRFTDVRQVAAPIAEVWTALHDREVLRSAIPGCERLHPVGAGRYSATLAARVGPLADTYRGTFVIEDIAPGQELMVCVAGRGRCGALELDLRVRLDDGSAPTTTALVYDARARVGGLVARLGQVPLSVAGGHITGCFFRDLERALRARSRNPSWLSSGVSGSGGHAVGGVNGPRERSDGLPSRRRPALGSGVRRG